MRRITTIAVLFFAASPAAAQTKPNAYDAYLGCLQAKAAALDDGKSDPRSIGAAMQSRCREERFAYMRMLEPIARESVIRGAIDRSREPDIDDAAAIVLEERVRKMGR